MRSNTLRFWCALAGAIYADTSVVRMSGVISLMNNSAYDGGEAKGSNDVNKLARP